MIVLNYSTNLLEQHTATLTSSKIKQSVHGRSFCFSASLVILDEYEKKKMVWLLLDDFRTKFLNNQTTRHVQFTTWMFTWRGTMITKIFFLLDDTSTVNTNRKSSKLGLKVNEASLQLRTGRNDHLIPFISEQYSLQTELVITRSLSTEKITDKYKIESQKLVDVLHHTYVEPLFYRQQLLISSSTEENLLVLLFLDKSNFLYMFIL